MGSHRQLQPLVWVAPPRGFIAPSARIAGVDLRLGSRVFIGDRVVIASWDECDARETPRRAGDGKPVVTLADNVQINRETTFELFAGARVTIGSEVGIQMRCHFEAADQPISIGARAMIAPYCVFLSGERRIGKGPPSECFTWESNGPIIVEDDAWLGVGVKVVSGVTIGKGAVVAAGSVVTCDIPAGAIAGGNPARIIRHRDNGASDDGRAKNAKK